MTSRRALFYPSSCWCDGIYLAKLKDHVRQKQAEEITSEEIDELKQWLARRRSRKLPVEHRVPQDQLRLICALIDFFELNLPEPEQPAASQDAKPPAAHSISRSASCAMCRAGWNLSYGNHTTRHSSKGTAWCEWCKSWIQYKDECFTVHRNRKRQRCPGSGKMIPGY